MVQTSSPENRNLCKQKATLEMALILYLSCRIKLLFECLEEHLRSLTTAGLEVRR
jgi:hypothetical protein